MANESDIQGEAESDADASDPIEDSSEEILKVARARLKLAEEAESEIRRNALDDLEFLSGKQWHDQDLRERQEDRRPCLTINRLPQFVQQITNDQRQNRPSIKVHPADDASTVDTAKTIQGLIRHIEYRSSSDVAYDTASESAARGGLGYLRVLTAFVSPESFDQELLIKRIRDPFSVYFDPYSQEPDGSDSNFAFIVDDLSPEDFRAKFPGAKLSSVGLDLNTVGSQAPDWVKSDNVRVAEYFYKEFKTIRIHLLATGETVRDEELASRQQSARDKKLDASIVRSRLTKLPVIKWVKLNGIEILDQTEWLGTYIPVIPVYGNELYVNGKRILESVIRHAKDSQRMYNYWKSAETETIALAPRAPFVGVEGQFEGHEAEWETANRRNHAYLEYKPTSLNGEPAPPPQRQSFEPATQAITQAAMQTADDLKATTGIYDAGMGAQGNETSGVAIQKRATQVQTANFHFTDNMNRSLRHLGRVLVDLIPKIYDTARAARIIGDDGEHKVVHLNRSYTDQESGKEVLYDLDCGRYDVTIDTGPSYQSKRQEAASSMLELAKAAPQVLQVAGDILVKNMDWPGAEEVADRLKATLPPALQNSGKPGQIPPQVQAQMQQMQMMIQELSKHLNEKSQIIEKRAIDRAMLSEELAHRERIELAKVQADIEINLAKLQTQGSVELLRQQVSELMQREKLAGINQPMALADPNNFAPDSASAAPGAPPTGGASPGSPMEGN